MKKPSIKSFLIPVTAIIIIYAVFHFVGIGCPIKYLTGISCAGCGMTRAWMHALKLDFEAAFYYHPLWMLTPVLIGLILFKQRLDKKIFTIILSVIIAFFIIIYIIRLISPDNTVVVIDTSQSAVIKLMKILRRIIEL